MKGVLESRKLFYAQSFANSAFSNWKFTRGQSVVLVQFSLLTLRQSLCTGCWRFNCICTGIGNHTSIIGYCGCICWKGIWANRTRIARGCFLFSYCYGAKPVRGNYIC
ncbi:hypothetical protein EJD97_019997 [Solanum chilense]|uniref:Uncharacterized protein n=1 Tax=Solanum chilense TaxID=4083 RepID=A0A6N2ADN2_SOLCI|nr:hypothetical protein EJD97_019997 [Solanum chilense]